MAIPSSQSVSATNLLSSCMFFSCLKHQKAAQVQQSLFCQVMTQLWKVEDYVQELHHLEKLAQCHPESKLVQTLATSLCAKLKASQQWTSSTIIQVLEKLDQANLPNDLKKAIQDAIDQIGLADGSLVKTVIAGQHIDGFCHYLSKEDWTRMEQAPANTVHTMSIVASRLRLMGFVSLKEATKVEAMSVVFFCLIHKGQQPQPSPQTRYALVDEFVSVFGKTPSGTVPSLNRYPANPAELGKQWLDQVYGADEPAMVSIGAGWKNMVTQLH